MRSAGQGLAIVCLLTTLTPVRAQAAGSGPIEAGSRPPGIPLIQKPPRLTDFLNSETHSGWLPITGFLQREPKDGGPPSRATTAYLSADSRSLHVAFICEARPNEIRAHLSKRDRIAEDDSVAVFIDTQKTGRMAYYFFANPLGVQLDGIMKEGEGKDASFDTVWTTQARVTSSGYAVLFSIPYRSIRITSSTLWGLALTRYSPHTNESVSWPHISRSKDGFISHFAAFQTPAQEGARLPYLVTPYLFGARGAERVTTGGVDAQVAIRNQFNLDFTYHPDYSQAESDDPRNTINRRFEVYFPEKRPFFVDHASYFGSPESLFFSRRILRPNVGARFTGSANNWSTGFLEMDDEDGEGGRARITVGRLEHSFNSRRSIGGMFLRRATAAGENTVGALDGRWRFRDNWALTAQTTHSETRSRGGVARSAGQASYLDIHRTGNHLSLSASYRDRSPDFQDDLGYIPRVNVRQVEGTAGYLWRPEGGRVLSYGPSVTLLMNRDWSGRLLDWSVGVPFWIDLPRSTSIVVEREQGLETYRGIPFQTHSSSAYLTTEPAGWLAFNASHRWGRDINYDPASGQQPFAGQGQDQSAGVSIRPGKRLRFDQMVVRSELSRSSRRVFENRMVRFRINYQISRALSLRAIADWNHLYYDRQAFNSAPVRPRAFDLLASWQSTQGLILFAGYSHGVRRWDSPTGSNGGVAYVKIGYQFRP